LSNNARFSQKHLYCNIIKDYKVGSLFKNTRWTYFTLLQLTMSWINVCRFSNHSPGYLEMNVLFYIVLFLCQSVTVLLLCPPHSEVCTHVKHLTNNCQFSTYFTTPWSLVLDLLLQHWGPQHHNNFLLL
jgi:hypothetical protein